MFFEVVQALAQLILMGALLLVLLAASVMLGLAVGILWLRRNGKE